MCEGPHRLCLSSVASFFFSPLFGNFPDCRATKPMNGFESTSPSASEHPRFPKSGAGPSIALPKLNKPLDDPKGYPPVSLLCVPYNFMERLLHARIDPVIDSKLPNKQAGFHHGKSAVDHVTLLTNDIKDTFQAGDEAGVVFRPLTTPFGSADSTSNSSRR